MDESTDSVPPPSLGSNFEREFPGASSLATEGIIKLVLTALRLDGMIASELHPYAVSMAAVNVLEILRGAGEPLPPSVISERRMVTRGTMTSLLDTLERRGLLCRLSHPHDRRMLLVDLTDAGRSLLTTLMPELHRQEFHWLSSLTDDEKRTLVRLLDKVQEGLATRRPSPR
jgi:DNA-binding MarR family transcriptional regulator